MTCIEKEMPCGGRELCYRSDPPQAEKLAGELLSYMLFSAFFLLLFADFAGTSGKRRSLLELWR